ncbi:hypothetical protein AGMMS49957_17610 [Synergistales bacterium]|nr:hypothetical protein AGMMS49957_17610 [Synergistales bacterium]
MGDKTIRAKNEIEREKNFTPQEALEFLRGKKNFRFMSDGIERELHRLGYTGNTIEALRACMDKAGIKSADGKLEKIWLEDGKFPDKEYAIKLCFAFGLSSKKDESNPEAVTALEFLWNVCRVNGFNYRCADDIIYSYALDNGKRYECAAALIKRYEAETNNIAADDSEGETKGTSTLWEIFGDLKGIDESELLAELKDNAHHFYNYNKTSKKEFIKLYDKLTALVRADIEEDKLNAENGEIEAYERSKRQMPVAVYDEIIYDGYIRALTGKKRGNLPDAAKTVLGGILDKFPTKDYIDEMRSLAKDNLKANTDLGHGYARKVYLLCFFANYAFKGKVDYEDFYRALDSKLLKCSYGVLYPANPFDWIILNSIRSLCREDVYEADALELLTDTITQLVGGQLV